MATHTAPPIRVSSFKGTPRAEMVFSGVDQAGPSFEGRVFLNNPDADVTTARTPETGYAGSFHVYAYGEPAPPAIADAKTTRAEGGQPIAPIEKRLHAHKRALAAALAEADELTITVVPIPVDPQDGEPERPFEQVEILFR